LHKIVTIRLKAQKSKSGKGRMKLKGNGRGKGNRGGVTHLPFAAFPVCLYWTWR